MPILMLAFCVCTPPDADIVTASAPTSPTSASALKPRSFTVSSSLGLVASDTGHCVNLLLRLPPSGPVRERELRQRLGSDLDAAAGGRRREVAPADDPNRVDEVLVQVVDELAHAVLERRADRDVVEHGGVLRVFAEPDAAGMRADRHAELGRQEDHREYLVHAAQSATVELADVDRLELEQLLEDDPVLHVLARRDTHGRHRLADPAMAEDVVGARRLFDPPRIDLREHADRLDRLLDTPGLVRVEREAMSGADRLTDEAGTAQIGLEVAADLQLQMREPFEERRLRTFRQRRLRVAQPARRRRIRGEAVAEQVRLALRLRRFVPAEDRDGLGRGERVLDVAEVDAL